MKNHFLKWGLQILIGIFLDRMYIFCFDFKNTIENQEFHYPEKIFEI